MLIQVNDQVSDLRIKIRDDQCLGESFVFWEGHMSLSKIFTLTALCTTLSTVVIAEERTAPEVTIDGLHLVRDTKMALVYAKPDVDLSHYNRFYIVEPKVAFEKRLKLQKSCTQHFKSCNKLGCKLWSLHAQIAHKCQCLSGLELVQ